MLKSYLYIKSIGLAKAAFTGRQAERREAVEDKFRSLNAALRTVIAELPVEKQAELAALIDAEVDETHQAVLDVVAEKMKASEMKVEIFDEKAYQQKLTALLSYSEPVEFTQLRGIPRDDGSFPWIRTLEYFAPKPKIGKWMRAVFIEAKNRKSGASWVQNLFLQEWDSYDKHAWEMETGESVLPIRIKNNEIEAAISVKNPAGAGGKAMFSSPRYSWSNKNKPVFHDMPAVHKEYERPDFNRMTGKVLAKVVLVDGDNLSKVDEAKEKIVWFNLAELEKLLTDPKMQDAITISLIRWLLLNADKVTESFGVKR